MFSKHGLVFAVHGLKLLSDSKKRSLHTLKLNKTVPSQTTAPLLEQVLQVDDSSIGLSVFFAGGWSHFIIRARVQEDVHGSCCGTQIT